MPTLHQPTPEALFTRRTVLLGGLALGGLMLMRRDGAAMTVTQQQRDDLGALLDTQRDAMGVDTCMVFTDAATGLLGTYYAEDLWRGTPLLQRTDAAIDFDPELAWPAALSRQRPRSVRWTGWLRPLFSGRYQFHSKVENVRITVAQQVLAGPGAPSRAVVSLVAGRLSPVMVEIPHLAERGSRLRLEWTTPQGVTYPVPKELLYLPSETV